MGEELGANRPLHAFSFASPQRQYCRDIDPISEQPALATPGWAVRRSGKDSQLHIIGDNTLDSCWRVELSQG